MGRHEFPASEMIDDRPDARECERDEQVSRGRRRAEPTEEQLRQWARDDPWANPR